MGTHRGSSNVYQQSMFRAKILKISFFFQMKFSYFFFSAEKKTLYIAEVVLTCTHNQCLSKNINVFCNEIFFFFFFSAEKITRGPMVL